MARLFIGMALAALVFAVQARAAQIEPDIIGYGYTCSVRVPMPLPSSDLEGHLTILEDGTRDNFFAQLYGTTVAADPIVWATAKTLRRRGLNEVVRWDMTWREEAAVVPMSFGAGYITIDVSTARKLALENVLVLARPGTTSEPLVMGGRRHPGLKSGAEFLFEISDLLAFAGDSGSLDYWLFSDPLPRDWRTTTRRRRASGTLDLSAPRSVAAPFARLRAELLAKAEDSRSACQRRPIHSNPDTEI